MSSYKRIPKSLVKKAAEPITITEDFAGSVTDYCNHVEENGLQKVKEKIDLTEQTMLQELQAKRASWVEQAYQEGFQKAKKELEQEVYQQHEHLLREAKDLYEQANRYHQSLIQEAEQLKEQYVAQTREQLLALVLTCSEKLVRQTLTENPAQIAGMFEAVLREITYENKKVFLRMHPKTKDLLTEHTGLLGNHIETIPDPTLTPGDLIIETEREQLDATIDTQIKALKEIVRSAIHD